MGSFAKAWQEEVRRLARKEVKGSLAAARAEHADLKREIAALRKRVNALAAGGARQAAAPAPIVTAAGAAGADADAAALRMSGKAVRMLRKRLGLTQAEFAALLGVTAQSVYQWEHKEGRIRLRRSTTAAFAEVRRIGAREARRRLDGASV